MMCINDERDLREIHIVVLYTALDDLVHLLVIICNCLWTSLCDVYLSKERGIVRIYPKHLRI